MRACWVPWLCPALRPHGCSPPGSSVHRTFQARILEWVAVSSSRGSSWPRDRIHVPFISCNGRQMFYLWAILVNRCSQMGTSVYVTRPMSGSLLTFWYKRPQNQPLCCLYCKLGAVVPGLRLSGIPWSSFLVSTVEDHARRPRLAQEQPERNFS